MSMLTALTSFFKSYSKQPWSKLNFKDDKICSVAYNKAFVDTLRASLHEELTIGTYKTDQEVVDLWMARRNYEAEPPKLEVLHSAIDSQGRLNLKLNWNDAFIRMLRAHDFEGETEDQIIQAYLASIARDNAEGTPLPVDDDGTTAVAKALTSLDPHSFQELEQLLLARKQNASA